MTRSVAQIDEAASPARQRYVANLGALYRRDPDLAAEIDALPFSAATGLEAARDGNATAQLTIDDGRTIHVHSRYRPLDEVEKFIAGQPVPEHPTFLLSGLGLGYHVLELERRHDRPVMIVGENDLGLIKAALCLHDLSAIIGDGRLILLTSTDNHLLHEKLTKVNADLVLGLHLIALPHSRRCNVEFHEQLRKLVTEFVAFARMQIVTLLKNARITFRNIAHNLPSYLAGPGIETLQGRAAGFPAIIVAAGPSLARNLDQLGALRERAVVIGVQTVLKLLHKLKLPPHFVTSLDFHEVSAEFFRGLEDFGDCTLVAEPKATWHVLDIYRGKRRVLHHPFYDMLLKEQAPRRAGLTPGTTVAHLAFYLAQYLGCDPIIFVGQDLAFSEGMFYMPGSPIENIWRPELNRFQTLEMKQWERIVRNRSILHSVRDIHGRPTYTDDLLTTYIAQFEQDFATAPQRLIQASEGGVPLAGTEVMPLAEAARRFCTRPLPADLFAERQAAAPACSKDALVAELATRLEELEYTHKIARETMELLGKLEACVERPAEFNRLMVRVDALRTLIHKYPDIYRLVIDVSASAELRRYTADRRIGKPEKETAETARRRLRRDRDFVASFVDGCEFLAGVIPEAIARVREQM